VKPSRPFPPLQPADLLRRANLRPRKSLGQNFLMEESALEKVADAAGIRREDTVLEIGAGLGSLTRHLADRADRVVAVEIDRAGRRVRARNAEGDFWLEYDALIGGEESGGYGFRGHIPERDGVLAGLYFLDYVRRTGKSPSKLLEELYDLVGPHHYDRLDQELQPADRARVAAVLEQLEPARVGDSEVHLVDRTDGVRLVLRDGSWLLFRLSGTEPLVRIYAEAESVERVQTLLAQGRSLLGL